MSAEVKVQLVRPGEDLSLLEKKINELQLRIEGTALEQLVHQLYAELRAKGLKFMPRCYLSDEWGCPDGVPVIGIPFYLADPMLAKIEEETTGDLEGDPQIIKFLRHEAGHAYNYAYRLYESEEWHSVFGPYTRPYVEDYQPAPFSKKFVRHLPGWYAQKHPDEDFAETFAVWLTPRLDWRDSYKGWPALAKLEYVDRLAASLPEPPVDSASVPVLLPVEEMDFTVREFYERREKTGVGGQISHFLDGDLRDVFGPPDAPGDPAHRWILRRRSDIVREISYWSGARAEVLRDLLDHLAARAQAMRLTVSKDQSDAMQTRFSVMLTTLVVSHLHRGRFIDV